jgi:hypothetical protein
MYFMNDILGHCFVLLDSSRSSVGLGLDVSASQRNERAGRLAPLERENCRCPKEHSNDPNPSMTKVIKIC